MRNRRGGFQEYSAGGIVTKGAKFLLIQMAVSGHPRDPGLRKGDRVWTFPKGHLDPGETPRRAALREVFEETGFACEIRASLPLVRYSFRRKGREVRKRVRWYWMRAGRRLGKPDADEIFGLRWATRSQAEKVLRYPADFRLLARVAGMMNGR